MPGTVISRRRRLIGRGVEPAPGGEHCRRNVATLPSAHTTYLGYFTRKETQRRVPLNLHLASLEAERIVRALRVLGSEADIL
jgi:hypothetical protein